MYEITRAQQLYQQSQYKQSADLCQSILGMNPGHSAAKFLLIMNLIHLGDLKRAEEELGHAIADDPEDDHLFYAKAHLELEKEQPDKAREAIERALSMAPEDAAYYAVLSRIEVYFREFEKALTTANQGLVKDPENEECLNAKADALTKLGRTKEADEVFKRSLNENPENDYTFAALGYSALEKGRHKDALNAFKQSLALNPENELAISGIKLAIKAKFFLYRWMLNLTFAMSKLSGKVQMFLVIGLYILYRFLNNMADKNPDIALFIQPFLYLYLMFVFASWFLNPLANFALRLHPYGKYALDKLEKSTSAWVGGLLLTSLAMGVGRLIWTTAFPTFPAIYFLFMAMAAAACGMMQWKKDRKKMLIYTGVLAFIGVIGMVQEALTYRWGLFPMAFIVGIIGLQLYANYLLGRR